ncbi:peptidase E [Sanguibacter antarcticus]|nr:peptidase E [Sanguibacter antarcticus]
MSEPTILATSGGLAPGVRTRLAVAPLFRHAVDLAGADGTPRVCHVGTAGGDQAWFRGELDEAGRAAGLDLSHLNLFTMPNVDDVMEHLLAQDVVWVGGGSVANLLAVWRVHGLDSIMHTVWEAGVVLSGVSAGSICWHLGGTTDSFGPELRAVHDGLGLLPYANGVHYDSEPGRRPLMHSLVGSGELPTAYCTDDGVGLVYRGTTMVEAVTEQRGKGAYLLTRGPDGESVVEERIEPRVLPGAR